MGKSLSIISSQVSESKGFSSMLSRSLQVIEEKKEESKKELVKLTDEQLSVIKTLVSAKFSAMKGDLDKLIRDSSADSVYPVSEEATIVALLGLISLVLKGEIAASGDKALIKSSGLSDKELKAAFSSLKTHKGWIKTLISGGIFRRFKIGYLLAEGYKNATEILSEVQPQQEEIDDFLKEI